MRADFPAAVRKLIAERAGYQCSVLNCGRLTVGPGVGPRQTVNIGVAAHIYAASLGGPRGTGGLSAAERSEPENGIWCCSVHGTAIDADDGRIFSATQLRAWKRLHEARKAAEVNGGALHHIGLVESIAVNSAPAAGLEGRTFDLGMRNIITGPNSSGKSILTRLIASVACPDHVADMSRCRDVDMAIRWFDPHTHRVATKGRAGNVTHVLDDVPVPYVARPYKTILLSGAYAGATNSIIELSQLFDLSISAMKTTLDLLPSQCEFVKDVRYNGMQVNWVLEVEGRTLETGQHGYRTERWQFLILAQLAAFHASHHARVEPTFLLLDEFLDFHGPRMQMAAMEILQSAAEHAQVAIVSHSPEIVRTASSGWTVTRLEARPQNRFDTPVDFEVSTSSDYNTGDGTD